MSFPHGCCLCGAAAWLAEERADQTFLWRHKSHPCHLSQTTGLPQSSASACSRDQKGDREDMGSLTGSLKAYTHTAYEVKSQSTWGMLHVLVGWGVNTGLLSLLLQGADV